MVDERKSRKDERRSRSRERKRSRDRKYSRSRDRKRKRSRSREYRKRSRSRDRRRKKSRSRSVKKEDTVKSEPPQPVEAGEDVKKERRSKWDAGDAEGNAAMKVAAQALSLMGLQGTVAGVPVALPQQTQAVTAGAALAAATVGAQLQDTAPDPETAAERQLLLSNVVAGCQGCELVDFFNGAILAACGQSLAATVLKPVVECTTPYNGDKTKAMIEFRTPTAAMVGMRLSGIEWKGSKLLVQRGPLFQRQPTGDPSATLNMALVKLDDLIGKAKTSSSENKLSIFNLSPTMPEAVVQELLEQFGPLKMLNLIKDLVTGELRGYGFFEYFNDADAELAIVGLNGFVCGSSILRVSKLGAQQPKPQREISQSATLLSNSMTQKIVSNPVLALQVKTGREVGSIPSVVVQLLNCIYQEDLLDDGDHQEILEEIQTEANKYGIVEMVLIPKPSKDGTFVEGVGKVFVQFQDVTSARKFQAENNGRRFDGRVVCAAFFPLERFKMKRYVLH